MMKKLTISLLLAFSLFAQTVQPTTRFVVVDAQGRNVPKFTVSQLGTFLGTGNGNGIPITILASLPATCVKGTINYVTDASSSTGGFTLYACTETNMWSQISLQADGSGYVTVTCATPNSCLIGLNLAVVASKTVSNIWLGSNDFSTASKTAPFRLSATSPLTCDNSVRESYYNTTSNTLFFCNAVDTWTALSGGSTSRIYSDNAITNVTCNSTTEQVIKTATIPANTFAVGDTFNIKVYLTANGNNINPYFSLGSTQIGPTCCVLLMNATAFQFDVLGYVNTSTSETISGFVSTSSSVYSVTPYIAVNGTFDITQSITISIRAKCASGDTVSVITARGFVVSKI